MAEMMERIKTGNIQLKPVRTVSMDLSLMGKIVMLCCDIFYTLEVRSFKKREHFFLGKIYRKTSIIFC